MMIPRKSLPVVELRQELSRLNGQSGDTDAVVDFLLRESLLDATHVRAWAVVRAVNGLMAEGYGKIEAMDRVAEQMALSFFTVRKYIYTTYK